MRCTVWLRSDAFAGYLAISHSILASIAEFVTDESDGTVLW